MTDKYIVKNCPMYFHGNCYGHTGNYDCENCTDCLIKQVIENCKEDLEPIREWQEGKTVFIEYKKDVHLAREILQLFDIKEVE